MNAKTARPTDWVISRLWVTSSMRRLSDRSAIAPAHAERAGSARLARSEQTDRDPASGELEHEQNEGDVGEPIARVRDQLADEIQPEIAVPERDERLAQRPVEFVTTRLASEPVLIGPAPVWPTRRGSR